MRKRRTNRQITSVADAEIKRAANRLERVGDKAAANRLRNKLPKDGQ